MIKLSKCHLDATELKAVEEVFSAAYLGMGKQAFEFEIELKKYLNTDKEVICVNSGTAALHLALSCLGLQTGDEVLVPTLTFAACFQAISATGAKPVACDIQEDTLSIDLHSAAQHVNDRTRAIMPVHYASHAEAIDEIYQFAKNHQLRVIEDAAHAFGTTTQGHLVGAEGDIICFSFDGIKNITCGEGGAVVTGDQILAEKIRNARLLGIEKDSSQRKVGKRSWDFDIEHQGYRYHMSDIMAAIGRAQLRKVDFFKQKRQALVNRYLQKLANLPDLAFLALDYANIFPHIFVVRITQQRRDGLKEFLQQHNIEVGIHYKPNHLLKRYQTTYHLKNAEKCYQEILTLPLHVGLQDEEQMQVINLITEYLTHA